jgi:mitochondrial fission protein ELM1
MSRPRIWVLLGHRRGDNNQLLALAEGLGLPFETRTLAYRRWARPWMKLFARGTGHLDPGSKRWLQPPWPDLVIGIGRRSVAVARWIRRQSGDRARLIRLGHPRASNHWFDLIVTTRQYPVPDGDNVVRLPMAMNRFAAPPEPTDEERAFLDRHARPHRLVSLGGTAPMWRLDLAELRSALAALDRPGTTFVIPSPRTPPEALDLVRAAPAVLIGDELRYPVALADADEQYVTADSVSMISEAIQSGKPVGIIPVAMDARGRRSLGATPEDNENRDIRRFLDFAVAEGLVGSVAAPRAGKVEDSVSLAVAAVRERLGGLV